MAISHFDYRDIFAIFKLPVREMLIPLIMKRYFLPCLLLLLLAGNSTAQQKGPTALQKKGSRESIADSCGDPANFQANLYWAQHQTPTTICNSNDAGVVMAGRFTDGPQTGDAFVMRLDADGQPVWFKILFAGYPEGINKISSCSDGGFIAIGYVTTGTYAQSQISIIKLSGNGTIEWSRAIHAGSADGEIGYSIKQFNDGTFGFAGVYNKGIGNSDILAGRLAADGQLLWVKQYDSQWPDEAVELLLEDDAMLIVGQMVQPSGRLGILAKLSSNDGSPVWSKTFSTGTAYEQITQIIRSANSYWLSMDAVNQNILVRTALDGGVQFSGSLLPFGNLPSMNFIHSAESDNSLIAVHTELASQQQYAITKITAGGAVAWSRVFKEGTWRNISAITAGGPQKTWLIGSQFSAAANGMAAFLARTDSLGCNGEPGQLQLNPTTLQVTPFEWVKAAAPASIVESPGNYLAADDTPVQELLCQSKKCIPTPPADTCPKPLFEMQIGGPGNESAADLALLPADEYLIAGTTTTGSANTDALLLQLDTQGKIKWQLSIGGSQPDAFHKLLLLHSGDYLAIGSTQSFHNANGALLLCKVSAAGQLLWSKEHSFTHNSHTGLLNITGALEMPNGEIVLCGNSTGINTDVGQPLPTLYNLVIAINANGDLKWVKRYREYYIESGGAFTGMAIANNALFISATYGILKLDPTTGNLIGLNKKYTGLGNFQSIAISGNQLILFSNSHEIRFDEQLNLLGAWRWQIPEPDYVLGLSENASGTGIGGLIQHNTSINSLFLARLAAPGKLAWAYRYPFPLTEQRTLSATRVATNLGQAAVGSIAAIQSDESLGPADILLIRTDSAGLVPDCPRALQLVEPIPVSASHLELTARQYPLNYQSYVLNLHPIDPGLTTAPLCQSANCGPFTLAGPDTICRKTDTVTIRLVGTGSCLSATDWQTPAGTRVLAANDTLLRILFTSAGRHQLHAKRSTGCGWQTASLTLEVLGLPDTLNLGPDLQLCAIRNYTLHAGPGYAGYRWQNGSTDSVFQVRQAGRYYVTVTDACGRIYSDTVQVGEQAAPAFELGPDQQVCTGDSLRISLPTGFQHYYSDSAGIMAPIFAQEINLTPRTDTLLLLMAEAMPGCLVMDSLRITLATLPRVDLPADTSICAGDSLQLATAIPGARYRWNTGAATDHIWVSKPGGYSVTVTDSLGCSASDSMAIVSLHALPVTALGPNRPLCENQSLELDAGVFAQYQWQDGWQGRHYTVSSPGSYRVTVTDNLGCRNTDSIFIAPPQPLPNKFLDSAATICLGNTTKLAGKAGYLQYKWSTGQQSSLIVIDRAGWYWLEVVDSAGCSARDSIFVTGKDCLQGVFFPNAFSPNGDGQNDLFRPIIYGYVSNYRLQVFNRNGQLVFQTSDPLAGWDGTVNGQRQNTQTYTWKAVYRLAGGEKEQQSGTLTLIR